VDDTRTDQDDQAPDQASDDKPTDDARTSEQDNAGDRLDDLGDRIQKVRSEAEAAVEGVTATDEETYAESGDGESADDDDQTIAPPG